MSYSATQNQMKGQRKTDSICMNRGCAESDSALSSRKATIDCAVCRIMVSVWSQYRSLVAELGCEEGVRACEFAASTPKRKNRPTSDDSSGEHTINLRINLRIHWKTCQHLQTQQRHGTICRDPEKGRKEKKKGGEGVGSGQMIRT